MEKDQTFAETILLGRAEWRARATSGVLQAMAACGKIGRADFAEALGKSRETTNSYLQDHRWTFDAFVDACVYCDRTPAEVLALGAAPPTENLP